MPDCVRGGRGHFAVSNLARGYPRRIAEGSGARSQGNPPT
jgi:hypothetical protein